MFEILIILIVISVACLVGVIVKHEKVGAKPVICAGTATKDRAGTNLPPHLRDRLTWIEAEANAEDTCNYLSSIGVDTRLAGPPTPPDEQLRKDERSD